jgi:hypothetical protein
MLRGVAVAVLVFAAFAAQAPAVSEPPRQTYSERFTTDVPGTSTGRLYAIDFFNPDDSEAKPHSFSHLHVELAEGARFNTSALPQCSASDAELMAAGADACPADSKVATDLTVIDTGFPGPGRYATTDIEFFNNQDELVLVATVRENGARVVLRAQLGENTIDLETPLLPGTPPDGGAAKSQRGVWEAKSSDAGNFLTTPPTCPQSGFWVNRITWTYRDGTEQTAESRSPCQRAAETDDRAPRIRAAGIPRPCAAEPFRVRFRVADESRLRAARVRLSGDRIATSRRKRFRVRIAAGRLRPGRHTLRVRAVDEAGNSAARRVRFRRCAE